MEMFLDKPVTERNILVSLERSAVYRLLGYRQGKTTLSEQMKALVDSLLSEALALINPVGTYLIRKIRSRSEAIAFRRSKVVLRGQSIAALLRQSEAAVFMAVTIGSELEREMSTQTAQGHLDRALVLDAIGSEAAEAAANALNARLITLARQTKRFLTTRFSPGYGDLPLEVQKDLHEELSLTDLGITLTEKFLLFPQKTVTAILGVEK